MIELILQGANITQKVRWVITDPRTYKKLQTDFSYGSYRPRRWNSGLCRPG